MPTSPVSSGTVCFLPDILDLAQEAAERAGVDFTSGQALRSARMALDLMSLEWANEGLNLWQIDSQTVQFLPGIAEYTLPSDTLEIIYPVVRSVTATGRTNDMSMNRIDVTDYAAIPNKDYPGNPQQIFFNRQVVPSVTVWPVPVNTDSVLFYYRFRRIQDSGAVTNNMDIPSRFVPAMVAGLAYRFAQKSRDPMVLQKVPLLKAEYMETFDKARYEDRSKTSIFLTPMVRY